MSEELFVKKAKGNCGDGEMWPEVTVKIEKDSSEDHQGYTRPDEVEACRGGGVVRPAWAEVEVELEDTNDGGSPLWDDTLGAVTKTRVWWSDAETRVLLKLIQDINVGTILDGKRQRNAAVFKKIQRELSLRGVEKNWEAARWKWKALKAKYIAAKRAIGRNGAGTWTNFRFYSDMDKILGGRPNALRASAHLQGGLAVVTKTRVWWSDAETRIFLRLIQDFDAGPVLDGKRQRNAAMFKKIQREMSAHGVHKSWQVARCKWKTLKSRYIAAKQADGRDDDDTAAAAAGSWIKFRFYPEMDAILRGCPCALRTSSSSKTSAKTEDDRMEPSEEHAEAEECSDTSQLADIPLAVNPAAGATLESAPNPFSYESNAPEQPAGSPAATAAPPFVGLHQQQQQQQQPCDLASAAAAALAASPSPHSSACSSPSVSSAIVDTFAQPAHDGPSGAHATAVAAATAAAAGRLRRHYQTRKLDSYMSDFRRMHEESIRAFRESEAKDAACMQSVMRLMERAVACLESPAARPTPHPPPPSNNEPFGSSPGE
ncbi:uncharacterized protein LOC116953458 isoform X1 [Petromyzon marinus]|uniref:Uncharacterized protein LOC116953458 isoform X1 n=1 Tax=Petromyzon marinus TaxID=7757 RepID=A0AAJ7XCE2_PETMA|nr:uncharacterized protein LOC116953458 isoform X1 [Petromyzon marinus]